MAASVLSEFFRPQENLDTVVFVHGLGGHYRDTWAEFPRLLASDPDLPMLDILLWGYRSKIAFGAVAGIETVGGELVSELSAVLQSDNAVHLAGHSLGGLVILHGLVGEMAMGKAREMPASNVSFITLFAAPVSGSSVAAVLSRTPASRQVREAARGPAMDDLLTKVVNRIYAPTKEDDSHRAIPIRMVMANRDQIVDATDRQRDRARFTRCAPLAYDYDHSTIKEPANHGDKRYMALASDVQAGFAQRFQQICCEILDGRSDVQESASIEFARRYEHIFRRRLEEHGVDVHTEPELYRSYLRLIVRECAKTSRPPFYAADRALVFLLTSGLVDA